MKIVLKLIVIGLVMAFMFHLIVRYNKLHTQYTQCIDTVRLYHNAWERRK